MAKRRKSKKVTEVFGLPLWLLTFISGFLVALLLFFGVRAMKNRDFRETIETAMAKAEEILLTIDEILYGDPLPEEPAIAEGTLRVDIIDVGQGESILITTAEKAVLIDAGENDKGDEVLAHLESLGITSLDLAIGTHAHSDHIGGMDTVLAAIPTAEFWMGAMPENLVPSTKTYTDVLEQLDIGRIPYREPKVGTIYDLGSGGILTVLGPQGTPNDLNNCSLVCRVDFGERSFLFNGDAEESEEKAILASGVDLDVDVMTMGHHGSSTSSSSAYFKAASPGFATISCGQGNSYGHPNSSTLKKLKNADIPYRRTDVNGTITIVTDGYTIEYSTEKG